MLLYKTHDKKGKEPVDQMFSSLLNQHSTSLFLREGARRRRRKRRRGMRMGRRRIPTERMIHSTRRTRHQKRYHIIDQAELKFSDLNIFLF